MVFQRGKSCTLGFILAKCAAKLPRVFRSNRIVAEAVEHNFVKLSGNCAAGHVFHAQLPDAR